MVRENISLIQLNQESTRLARIAHERLSLLGRIGTGSVLLGSSFEATLKVGNARRSVRASLERAESRREELLQAIGTRADEYVFQLNLKSSQLKQMEDMVASGDLPSDIVEQHRNEFEELSALPHNNEYLRRGIERLHDGGAFNDWVHAHENITLPNGKMLSGRKAELLNIMLQTSEDMQVDATELAHRLFPDKTESVALKTLSVLLSDTRKELRDSGMSIQNTVSKVKGGRGKYYLKRE